MISEHVSQGVKNDSKKPQLNEKPVKVQSFIQDQEIFNHYSAKARVISLNS